MYKNVFKFWFIQTKNILVFSFDFWFQYIQRIEHLKFRYYEKATKFEKISHLFWQNHCFYSVASKQVGDFFKFLWPFQKSWTLMKEYLFCLNLMHNLKYWIALVHISPVWNFDSLPLETKQNCKLLSFTCKKRRPKNLSAQKATQ